ncbi:MAG: hypothetical protein HY331_07190 [Chloroflexi bacterium]|nr:hypothetical protein [Chloroflexota bacterium]
MNRLSLVLGAVAAVVILGWIGFLIAAEQPGAGGHEADDEHAAHLAAPAEADNGIVKLAITIDPQEGATPADQVRFSARLVDATGKPVTNVQYDVVHWHLEDSKVVFATKAVAPDGLLEWQFDFFDGVPHEIRVTAAPSPRSSVQFEPITAQPVAALDAMQPPLRVKLLNTVYLVAVIGVGAVVGLLVAGSQPAVPARRRQMRTA